MRYRVGARSDIGRARQRNEDSFLVREPLFAVADGMGGHRGGNVASSLALETLGRPSEGSFTADSLIEGIKEANRRVLQRGESDRELRGMGTTITVLLADRERAVVAHVGDSRAYRLRNGSLQQLTEDHTLVQRMVREGRLSPDEAAHHPQRSILTRALGVEEDIEVDALTLELEPGDRLLLCTDGLTSMVGRDRIFQILSTEADPQAACDRLIEAANEAGGDDNITVIVVDFEEGPPEPDTKEREIVRLPVPTVPPEQGAAAGGAPTVPDWPGVPPAGQGEWSEQATAEASPEGVTGVWTLPDMPEAPVAEAPAVLPEAPPAAAEAEGPPSRRGARSRRIVVWTAAVVVLILGALIGARIYINHQWYVGASAGRVAIFNGIPSSILGFDLSHVEETTEVSAPQAEALEQWRKLPEGITASSLDDARAIVSQIRADVQEPSG